MLRLSRFLRALPPACAVLVAGAAALTSGQTAFAKTSLFGASSSSHVRERTEFRSTDGFVHVGIPPLSATEQKQLKGGFTNLLGTTKPAESGWKLAALSDPVTFAFSPSAYTVNEGDGRLAITVTRTGNTQSPASVQYQVGTQTGAGFAAVNSDYTGGTGVITFGRNEISKSFTITIVQDNAAPVVEPDELLYINLSNPKALDTTAMGGVVLDANNSQATVQIYDDDSTISFSDATFTAVEGRRTANLTLTRQGGSGEGSPVVSLATAATFTYSTSDGTDPLTGAKAPSDYTARTNFQGRFAAGQATTTISIPVIDDSSDEVDETFNVSIASPAPATNVLLGAQTSAQVTITDDDDTTVSFEFSSYSVGEGGGSSVIHVVRNGSNNDTSRPLTVDYSAFGGTARAGVDYTAVRGTLEFAANETDKTISIPILQDTEAENDETFFVDLSNVIVDNNNAPRVTGTASPIQTATVTIVEDDPSFNFAATAYTYNEGVGTASIVVTRKTGTGVPATVNYATSDVSTTASKDYITASGTLSFAADQKEATIPITIIDDKVDEDNEQFRVTLSNPSAPFQVGPQGTTTVTIVDNDDVPTVTVENVAAREGNLIEGVTKQRFVVRLSAESDRDITLRYATANGTATIADNDYRATAGTVTIPKSTTTINTSANIDVPIIDDSKFEPDEGYILVLSNAVNATLVTTRATGTILNDDVAPVSSFDFVSTSVSANEVDPNNAESLATLTVRRTGDTTTAATVTLNTADGTAISGADYAATTTILSFPANPNNTTQTQTTTVPILDDTVNEATETFTAILNNPTGTGGTAQVSTTNSTATVSITDNDTAPFISVDNPRVVEGDSGTTQLVFTATLVAAPRSSAFSDQTITANYATADGTATAGSDYVATSGTLTFAPRVRSQTISVTVITDTAIENDETLLLNLDSPQNATLETTQATGTIVNDDTPLIIGALSFTSDSMDPVSETAPEAILTVTRSQGADRAATVNYTTSDGSAVAGRDYVATSGTLTFPVGETSATIKVPISDDKLKEDDETFTVTLSNPSNNVTLPTNPTTTVTIADDEGTPTLSIADTQIVEGDSGRTSLLFTISLQPQSQNAVTVSAVTLTDAPPTGGTASPTASSGSPQDFRSNRATFTFAPGESTKTFPVTVLSDTLVEEDETVVANLYSASGAPLGRSEAVGTITNDDQPGGGGTIAFLSANYSINESAGVATITLGRSGNIDMLNQEGASARVSTGLGTATNGQDYRAVTNALVNFAPGETVKSFTIPIINNTAYEQNETVPLTLSLPSNNAVLGELTKATLTIIDDDPVSVAPRADSLSPSNPSTRTFTVTSTYSSDRGINGLSSVLIQIAGDARGGGFRAIYTPATKTLSLDTGGQTGSPRSNRVLTGKYGSLDCSKTTVATSGNTLSVTWTITLSFVNSQPIFVGATAPEGDSVFIRRGTWTAPAARPSSSTKNS